MIFDPSWNKNTLHEKKTKKRLKQPHFPEPKQKIQDVTSVNLRCIAMHFEKVIPYLPVGHVIWLAKEKTRMESIASIRDIFGNKKATK